MHLYFAESNAPFVCGLPRQRISPEQGSPCCAQTAGRMSCKLMEPEGSPRTADSCLTDQQNKCSGAYYRSGRLRDWVKFKNPAGACG